MPVEALLLPLRMPLFCSFEIIALVGCGIIFGPFFICDCSTPYFGSLNKEQLERYKKQFQNPEHFFRVGGEIKAVPYKPEKDHER